MRNLPVPFGQTGNKPVRLYGPDRKKKGMPFRAGVHQIQKKRSKKTDSREGTETEMKTKELMKYLERFEKDTEVAVIVIDRKERTVCTEMGLTMITDADCPVMILEIGEMEQMEETEDGKMEEEDKEDGNTADERA